MLEMNKKTNLGFTALLLIAMSPLALTAGCMVDPETATDEVLAEKRGTHCVAAAKADAVTRSEVDSSGVERIVEVTQVEDDTDQPSEASKQGDDVVCFDTYSDAMFHASAGAIDLPLDATLEDAEEVLADLEGSSTTGFKNSSIIAIDYDNTNYGGSSHTWTVNDSRGCNRYRCGFLNLSWCWKSYSATSLGGWNDRFESSKGYAGCNANRHYEHNNFQGASVTCSSDCTSLGALNNQVSSRKWDR